MICCDVLVVGAGLAGLRAAIAARQTGARVIVAVKGKPGRSGSSAMTTAGYAAVLPDAADDSVALHVEDTLRGGADIGDPDLVAAMCAEAAGEVAFLESIGAAFQRDGSRPRLSPSGDHSRRRVLLAPNNLGTDLTVPLADHAERIGVEVLAFHMAVELVSDRGRVCGAILFDTRNKRLAPVAAGATILATGGAGRLFAVTSNPNDVTGDGFALAYGAGAELRDMEFVQFYPWRCIDPFDKARVSIQPSTFVLGARLLNADGDRFMARFNPEGGEISTRDVGACGIFNEMRSGRGVNGGVRLDLSPLSPEDFERSNPKVAKYLAAQAIDYRSYPFVVSPEAHYWMGGVAIDGHGAASVAGLFAAGEVAGGLQGANRLNSNALPEAMVLGARAGARAAATAPATDPSRAELAVRDWADRLERPGGWDEASLSEALSSLRAGMWQHLGIIRNAGSLSQGLDAVRTLGAALDDSGPASPGAVRPWLEMRSLRRTAEVALLCAIERRESRGAHVREDYPARDPRWGGSIYVRRGEGDRPRLRFEARQGIGHAA